MAKQTFGSFKELLVKRELSESPVEHEVKTKTLVKIFRYVQSEIILSNVQLFADADKVVIEKLLKDSFLRDRNSNVTLSNAEEIVLKGLALLGVKEKSLLCELLGDEAKEAEMEHKRIQNLAEKYHPKDATEEITELKARIKEIQLDVVDIEMTLMTLENDGRQTSEPYHKAKGARERRRQLISRLEKQVHALNRKVDKK
jgi:hypothetical protein